MKNLSDFLVKFKNIKAPDESIKKILIKIIEKEYSYKLSLKDIKIDKYLNIYINAPTVLKNEIQLNKQEILKKIRRLSNKKINNII